MKILFLEQIRLQVFPECLPLDSYSWQIGQTVQQIPCSIKKGKKLWHRSVFSGFLVSLRDWLAKRRQCTGRYCGIYSWWHSGAVIHASGKKILRFHYGEILKRRNKQQGKLKTTVWVCKAIRKNDGICNFVMTSCVKLILWSMRISICSHEAYGEWEWCVPTFLLYETFSHNPRIVLYLLMSL